MEHLAESGDIAGLRDALARLSTADLVRNVEKMSRAHRALVVRTLTKDRAIAVFERLDGPLQVELVEDLPGDWTETLVVEMDPDDRARLIGDVPEQVAQRLLTGLSTPLRAQTMALLQWPHNSVGRRMSPQIIVLPQDMNAQDALKVVKAGASGAETVYTLAVVDESERLAGVVSLRQLLVAAPGQTMAAIAQPAVVLRPTDHEEDGARELAANGYGALPVVDAMGRVLGLFTFDDAYRILDRATDEDLARSGRSEPLDRPYLLTPVRTLYRRRIVWLFVLILTATLTVSVLDYFEDALMEVVALALFIPLLIGTAGNTGSQAATTCVRSMAVGDLSFADLGRVAARECATGLLLGLTLGAVAFVPATLAAGTDVAAVVALTLVVICTMAATVGSIVPMVARRAGFDPAVLSSPFIATFTDTVGLIVYFVVATVVLGL